ncbi:MAG: hypothetical protein HC876_23070 [Chloroflexaceae bacterium]|nr:hypothetical protein [Chloroflexaceae bacterium]
MRYALLATEGYHDQAAIGRLLTLAGLKNFDGTHEELDNFWKKFIPTYPARRQKIYYRLPVPSIYQSGELSVAVYQGEGSNLIENITTELKNHLPFRRDIDAFGIIVDADRESPHTIARQFAQALRQFFPTFSEIPGEITHGTPRTGLYVLPDNVHEGTLDTLLIRCADVVYADLKQEAETYLAQVDTTYKRRWKPFDEHKALIATIVSVLKPGATNTASIAQNKWIGEQSIAGIGEVAALSRFLYDLLEIGGLRGSRNDNRVSS